MTVFIEIQNMIGSNKQPDEATHHRWIEVALKHANQKYSDINTNAPELTIRLVSEQESQQLNLDYRQKDKPTNVLSFPFEVPEMIPTDQLPNYLGDLVVCESVLVNEAKEQHKSYQDHYTHLIIHGVLHLLGFDHIEDAEANAMENLEVAILAELGIADPYSPVST